MKKPTKITTGPNKANGTPPSKRMVNDRPIKLFDQIIFPDWCKACGICIAFCPKNVYARKKSGKPIIENPDSCIGCRFCSLHCPDFAITIQERIFERRKQPDET